MTDNLEQQLVALLRDRLGLDRDVSVDEPLLSLPGADSAKLLSLLAEAEDTFGIQFDDDRIFDATTVRELARLVEVPSGSDDQAVKTDVD